MTKNEVYTLPLQRTAKDEEAWLRGYMHSVKNTVLTVGPFPHRDLLTSL